MKPNVLLIIGMHRSGTSLVTQWLHRCGLAVGDQLLGSGVGNADGHFEDIEFYNLHCSWLQKRALPFEGFISQPPLPLTEDEMHEAKTLISQKNAGHQEWGWKEPRTCLWLSLYRVLLPDAFNLIVVRNFNDTISSMIGREYRAHRERRLQKLATRKGFSWLKWKYLKDKNEQHFFKKRATEYLKAWIFYYENIFRHISQIEKEKFLLVRYEDLIKNDHSCFDYLTQQWHFSLRYVPFRKVFKRNLISKTTEIYPYIKDKTLLEKAREIEQFCLDHTITTNDPLPMAIAS
jgi:hypothetical protein